MQPSRYREAVPQFLEGILQTMKFDVDHLLALGVVVRVGCADLWAATRRLLGAGVRIGTEEQLSRRKASSDVRPSHGENFPERDGQRL
jgi:hypothetical protein